MTRQSNTLCVGCSYDAPVWTTRELAGSYIQTSRGFAATYGFAEARIRLPRTPGLWPAFWLLPTLSNEGNIIWPPEIDVLEQYTSDPHVSIHSLHYSSERRQDEVDAGYGVFDNSLGDDYHTYAVNWTPYEIVWYVDGRETHRSTATRVAMPMYLILNLATGGIAGTPGDDLSQAVMDVDYVRVLDNSRAFGYGGAAQTPPSGASVITHVWNDLDGNGRQDGGEPALANWTMTAVNSANGQELRRQQTDATGDVVLSGLPSAGYRICAEMPPGWHNTRPAVTTTGQACYWISAMSGQSILLSFGQHFNGAVAAAPTPNPTPAPTSLDGVVMLSVDARPDSGQDFLLTTDLLSESLVIDSPGDSDAIASYRQVRARPGIYRVAPNLPSGWTLSSGQCGASSMTPGASEVFFTLDAGQAINCAFVFERVSNIWARVWNDSNGNGRLDAEENMLPDRRIRIYRDDVYTDQRRSDSGGLADFTQLHSGAYRVCIERDLGWTNTLPRIFDADGLACYWTGVPPGVDVAIYFGEKTGLQSPNAAPLVVIDIQPQPQVETPVTPPVTLPTPEPASVRLRVYLSTIVR
jgi:Glycosyl hydrolases family 16/SdrD B-like domain